jgi:hypothetical protein
MLLQPRLAHCSLTFFLLIFTSSCGGRLAEKPTRNVDLAGRWAVNASLSDDPFRLMEQQLERRHMQERVRRGSRARADGDIFFDEDYEKFRPRDTPVRKLVSLFSLDARRLDIRQSDRSLIISNGNTSTEYVFGQESVVSMLSGAADRRVGWQSDVFVVQTQSPDGPGGVQTYKTSPDGRQLIMTTRLRGIGDELIVTRVFDRLPDKAGPHPYK